MATGCKILKVAYKIMFDVLTVIFLIVGGCSLLEIAVGVPKSKIIGVNYYVVVSKSMSYVDESNREFLSDKKAGFLQIDDVVFVKRIGKNTSLCVGDIVTFNMDGVTVIHRIVEIEEKDGKTFYHTRGDANNANDPVVFTKEDLKEKFVFSIPSVGAFFMFLKSRFGIIFLLLALFFSLYAQYIKINEQEKTDPLFYQRERKN